jgi:hypothetical protein
MKMGFAARNIHCTIEVMRSIFNSKPQSFLALGSLAGAIALVSGCGGGGGGGGSNTPSNPGPFDDTYNVTYLPSDAIASDAKAPTGTLVVNRGRANASFTYYVRPAAIARYQPQIDAALTKFGVAGDIRNNQIPTSITFNATKNVDSNGKLVFTANRDVVVCGSTTLTVDATFAETGGAAGKYKIDFPDHFTVRARGVKQAVAAKEGSCQPLPNTAGVASFVRTTPLPTATPTTPPAAG